MIVPSSLLGELEIEQSSIINFPEGIPAFEDQKQFVIVPLEENSPFYFLQSVQDEDLCLVIARPFSFFPDYEIEVADEELVRLEIEPSQKNLAIYVVLTIPEDFKLTTANLLAPIIINSENRQALQYVAIKSKYKSRHYIFGPPASASAAAGGRLAYAGIEQKNWRNDCY